VLRVEDIHTYYGDSYILQGISLEVQKGQVLGILGRNAMGKTTLIRSIIGFTPPRRGRVLFKEAPLGALAPYQVVRAGISIVPQGREIFPSLTVKENLTVGLRERPDGWNLARVYELFPPLKEREQHFGKRLSGGEQQMLAIGRALMTNPELLLMDEPTEGLSPIYVETVGKVIRRLQESGMAILLVEQNLRFAMRNTDFVHILNRGRIVHSCLPAELKGQSETVQNYLGV
jgi:branched-chain amino acid transport system ATP-binding protein